MALSVTPAPHPRARALHSIFSDRRTGRNLVTAFVLVRMALLVLSGRLDVVLAGSTDAETGQRSLLVVRSHPDPHETRRVLPQEPGPTEPDGVHGADPAVAAPAPAPAAALQATSATLVVAGLIGLFGVAGAAAFLVDSITRPVRRAVRVLQPPGGGHLDLRLRSITGDELPATVAMTTVASTPGSEPSAELTSVVPVIGRVVREAEQAHRLALEAERARAAEARTAPSAPVESSVRTARFAAARSRALGPTTALWHAVQVDRLVGPIAGACETTVCGSLVRVSTEQAWPVAARDVCPACATLAH